MGGTYPKELRAATTHTHIVRPKRPSIGGAKVSVLRLEHAEHTYPSTPKRPCRRDYAASYSEI
jgi:hypothetical protein